MKRIKSKVCSIVSFFLCLCMILPCGGLSVLAAGEDSAELAGQEEEITWLSDLDWEWAYAASRGKMLDDEANASASSKKPKKDYRYAGTNMPMYISYDACEGIYNYDTIIGMETTKKVDKGIGTEACSEIVYKIDGEYDEFRATLAFDAYTMGNSKRPSSVQFKVLGSKEEDLSTEYEELYDSGVVYNSDSGEARPYFVPQDIAVDVKDYKYLKLWVSDAGETGKGGTNPTNESDDVDWAFARLIKNVNESKYTYLSDMEQKDPSGNEVKNDTDYAGNAIEVNGQAYTKGLGMMADASVSYTIGGDYEYFTAEIGFAPGSEYTETQCTVYGINSTGGQDTITEVTLSKDEPYKSVGGPVTGIETLILSVAGEDGICVNWGDAKLEKAEKVIPVELSSITTDGVELEGFSPSRTEYTVEAEEDQIPVIGATAAEGLKVEITQAESVPGDAVISVSDGKTALKYTIHFTVKTETGITVDLLADNKELNPLKDPEGKAQLSVKAYDKAGSEIEIPEDAEIKYTANDLYKSGDVTVARVDEDGVVTPEAGGVSRITVNVSFGGNTYTDTINITVRPFYNDYHQSMVMKMFLGQNGKIRLNLDEALEVVQKVDNMTLGIPKIFYLVGWQYEGHDSGYPSFAKVNDGLKRDGDASARDSLIWFMEEAKKYNTTISLHINMLDASSESPLWEEYLEKDVIARDENGELKTYVWGYPISYTAEWNAGLTQRRIDELLELLPPLKEAGTIHIDAFHTVIPGYTDEPISPYHAEKYGYTTEVEEETQRKIFQYFRDKGLDVTSEFIDHYRKDDFIGLQPMAWHFADFSTTEYLEIPASLYCGGDRGNAIFGENMAAESIIKSDKENLTGFMADFALKSVPFYFLNRFDRLTYEKSGGVETATFSDGVISWKNSDGSLHITQNGIVLRDGTDVFMPALWNENDYEQIFAYSQKGYENRSWTLPEQCADMESVDIYSINLTDVTVLAQNQPVTDGTITLSLGADQAVTIVPAGTVLDPEALERLGSFQLTAPENGAKNQKTETELKWSEALNAEDYTVKVAADSEFKNIIAEETVAGTSYTANGLESNTTYYWKVTANRYKEGVLYESCDNTDGVWSFRTEPSEAPKAPQNLSAIRSEDGVRLTWVKSEGADSYTVYRNDGSGFVALASDITENSWKDTDASAEVSYSYYVSAVNVRGESEPSATVKETANESIYLSDMTWKWAYANARGVMYGDEENIKNSTKPKNDYRYDGSNVKMYISMDPCYGEYDYNSILGKDTTIAVDKGIGTTASSEIVYQLDGQYETFVGTPAFDVYTLTNKNRVSSVQFKILGSRTEDNSSEYEVLYDSGIIYNGDKDDTRPYYVPKEISVSVRGYNYLKLWVSDANEASAGSPVNASDALDWAFARVTAVSAEEPEEVVKTDLGALIMYAKAQMELEDYQYVVPAVKKLFENALAEAEAVYEAVDAVQDEVDAAYEGLLAKIHLLGYTGDASELQVAYDIAAGMDLSIYTEETRKVMEDAIAEAEKVLANENALQDEIDAALKGLNDAKEQLELIPVDKSALEKLIKQAAAYDEKIESYTPATAEVFKAAYTGAKEVYEDGSAVQEEVDSAYTTLQQAIFGLREIPNKDKLQDLIEKAENLDLSKYSDETAQALTFALSAARTVFADENAVAADVYTAENNLQKAIDGLKEKDGQDTESGSDSDDSSDNDSGNGSDSDPDNGLNNGSGGSDTVKTGDNANIWLWAVLLIASGTVIVLKRNIHKRSDRR